VNLNRTFRVREFPIVESLTGLTKIALAARFRGILSACIVEGREIESRQL
jgi:hypothetical protein